LTALIACEKVAPGAAVFVEHDGRELAVYHLTDPDRFVVSNNACPHANGNLSGGEIHGHTVTCPWHHWMFDLTTGLCVHSPKACVRVYPSVVRDGMVVADLG